MSGGKKSPRRSDEDGDDEASEGNRRAKKPRRLLFASPSDDDTKDYDTPPQTADSVRNRMSNLNLTQNNLESMEVDYSMSSDLRVGNGAPSEFCVSQRGSPAPSDASNGFLKTSSFPAKDLGWNYDLRENIDRQIQSTWLDHDNTGNYDPQAESREKAIELNKAKARKKKGKQQTTPKQVVKKFIVRLSFKAIGNVLNLTDGEDRWPDGWSELDTEDGKSLDETRVSRAKRLTNVRKHQPQSRILDPKGELDDLTGHPIARGCKGCRMKDTACSMVKDGEWPCHECEDGNFCQPIIKPKIKGRCVHCEELGEENVCSFEKPGQKQGAMCDQCVEAECEDCIAGPAPGYKHPRIDLDQIMYGPDRKWVECTHCREHHKRCSLKDKTHKPPCKGCARSKIGCTFYDLIDKSEPKKEDKKKGKEKVPVLPEQGKSTKDASRLYTPAVGGSEFFSAIDLADLAEDDEEEFVREATPEIEMADDTGRAGLLTKIDTCFAHPIKFHVTTPGIDECSFCTLPTFGLLGHFEKTVHVLKYNDGLAYGEIAAGHGEEFGQTSMCQQCTMSRYQIIQCSDEFLHDIQPIKDNDRIDESFNEAIEALIQAEPQTDWCRHQMQRWCSMCLSLASFKCCTRQQSSLNEDGAEMEGCGLQLCGECKSSIHNLAGNSSALASELDKKPKLKQGANEKHDFLPRADVGFLDATGILMRNVANDFGEES
ncbi:hypothetical protein K504DRAFT_425704 [Pleomassaria siparia CBS 279.74]|uniref:Zn(2)-C6 fungal-type domain-containing protein n=1 Tax=Pleomassaria siparia CBS 279.74 TaxID=1314801 RepID=A0A6G1KHD0_9PLEO|nr:hypothetical protein K504DRAFT_425704 [Pleomassaria siparia CBS 279.74]